MHHPHKGFKRTLYFCIGCLIEHQPFKNLSIGTINGRFFSQVRYQLTDVRNAVFQLVICGIEFICLRVLERNKPLRIVRLV